MKLPKKIYKHTNYFFNDLCKPELLFALALCCFPLYLFVSSTKILWTIAGFFLLLSLLRRGKVRILPSIIITAGIVILALLSPSGKVLMIAGPVKITDGALDNGFHRSAVLCGMVFLSQFAVSPKLYFPGRIGLFFSQMFKYFDKLTAVRISFKPGSIISSIDDRLIEIWNQTESPDTAAADDESDAHEAEINSSCAENQIADTTVPETK